MTTTPIRSSAAALLAIAALAVAGCGGGSSKTSSTAAAAPAPAATTKTAAAPTKTTKTSAASSPAPAGSGAQTIKVTSDPSGALKFTQTSLHAKAGKVTLKFVNPSSVPHSIAVEGNGVDKSAAGPVTGGKSNAVTATLKPGTYTFYCPVDGHEKAGMRGTLTVT
jgi:plastocyanin